MAKSKKGASSRKPAAESAGESTAIDETAAAPTENQTPPTEPSEGEAGAPSSDTATDSGDAGSADDGSDAGDSNEASSAGDENSGAQGDDGTDQDKAPDPEPVAAAAPKAKAEGPTIASRINLVAANYEASMGRRIIPQQALREGATNLQTITQLVVESGTKEACDAMLDFHVRNKDTLMSENKALRGTDNLSKAWMGRVEMMYHLFRCLATGRSVAIDDTRFIAQFNYSAKAQPQAILDYIEKKAKARK